MARTTAGARKAGQAALEYLLAFMALLAIVIALWQFVKATRRAARQTTELVTSDYP